MSSKRQRLAGYRLPAVIDVEETTCISFNIPNDREYIAAARGAIYELLNWVHWEKSYVPGDTRASQAAALMRKVILPSFQVGGCPMPFDVRQNEENPCILEKTEDGENWDEFANLRKCKPKIRILPDGTVEVWDEVNGEWDEAEDQTPDPRDEEPPAPEFPPGGDDQCIASVAVEAGIKAILAQVFGATFVFGAIATVVAGLTAGLAALFTAAFVGPLAAGITAAAGSIMATIGQNFGDLLLAYDWNSFRCFINERMPSDGILTESAYDTIGTDLDSKADQVSQVINVVWDLIGFNGAKRMIEQNAPNIPITEQCCAGDLFYGTPIEVEQYKPSTAGQNTMQFRWPDVEYRTVGYRIDNVKCIPSSGTRFTTGIGPQVSPFQRTGLLGGVILMGEGAFVAQINYVSFPGANTAEKQQAARDAMDVLLGNGLGQEATLVATSADGDAGADGYVEAGEDFQADVQWGTSNSGVYRLRIRPIHRLT